MKKIIILCLSFLLPLVAAGQNRLDEIATHLQTDLISLHYDCTYTEDTPVKLSGTLVIQGNCYLAKGNGVEIYSDGSSRWTVDPAAKEVYVEPAEGLDELRAWRDSLSDIRITGLKYLPLLDDLSGFRFDTARLGSDWIVTDLR